MGGTVFTPREHGAIAVTGIDISERMLAVARENPYEVIIISAFPWRILLFPKDSFDIVLSSLAFHYLESFTAIAAKISAMLPSGGDFVFQWSIRFYCLWYAWTGFMTTREYLAFSCGPLFLRGETRGTLFGGTGGEIPPYPDDLC